MTGTDSTDGGSSQPEPQPAATEAAELESQMTEIDLQEAKSSVEDTAHLTVPLPPTDTTLEQPEVGSPSPELEQETTQPAHFPTSEAAGRSDPSLGTSQPSTSHTGVEKYEAREKDEGSWQATTLTIPVKARRRRKSGKSASHGKGTVSSNAEETPSTISNSEGDFAIKRRKVSFFKRITSICTSCVTSSSRAHEVDIEEGASRQVQAERQIPEKLEDKDTVCAENVTREPPSATTLVSHPPPLTITDLPPPPTTLDPDIAIIVPPTPIKQLLPLSDTDGLTSGAVQPPGSTGEETKHDVVRVTVGESGEDSDGSSEDESFEDGHQAEEWEDDEQRLIRQGGAGFPVGPDGTPQPLLPVISPKHAGRKCLVLDLDETLVHSSLRPVPSPDYIVPVEIENNWHNFYVLKRPGVDNFLRRMGDLYEVVVFTASLNKYADPVLDRLDPGNTVAHRLFRESCFNHRGNYVKDLSQLGRPIADTIILDNSPASYIFHPHNAVPVSSWFNDPHDTELTDLCPFLEDLSTSGDVRGVLNPAV